MLTQKYKNGFITLNAEKFSPVTQETIDREIKNFEPDENVGYVTESWEHDGKFLPSKGCYDRTAGQLIKELYARQSNVR